MTTIRVVVACFRIPSRDWETRIPGFPTYTALFRPFPRRVQPKYLSYGIDKYFSLHTITKQLQKLDREIKQLKT